MQPTRWLERELGEFNLSQRSCHSFVDVNSISPEQIAAEIVATADVEMLTIGGFYREARRIKAISYLQFI